MDKPSCSRCRKRGSYSSIEEADGELRCICYGVGDVCSEYVCQDEYACAERARKQRDAAEAKVKRARREVADIATWIEMGPGFARVPDRMLVVNRLRELFAARSRPGG